jgi:hypothetical protein
MLVEKVNTLLFYERQQLHSLINHLLCANYLVQLHL